MTKILGKGTTLSCKFGTTGFVAVGQVRNVSRSGGGSDEVDTTTLDNSDNFKTSARGFADPGSVAINVAYDPLLASHKSIVDLYTTGSTDQWQIGFPSTTTDTQSFSAFVSDIGNPVDIAGLTVADITLKISGHPGYSS